MLQTLCGDQHRNSMWVPRDISAIVMFQDEIGLQRVCL